MKKPDTDIQDIYRAEDFKSEESEFSRTFSEQIAQQIRKQQRVNLFAGLAFFILTGALLVALINNYIDIPEESGSVITKAPYTPAYSLPADEQWVIEYQQAAAQVDGSEPPGSKKFSTQWLKNAAYHSVMGEQALRQNDLIPAQRHFEKALEIFPEMTGIQGKLGVVYLKQQNFEEAVRFLLQVREENPSTELLNNLGVAYTGLRKYDQAEAFFRQALQLQPDSAGCHRNLALMYQKAGRTGEAVAEFEKYFSINPQDTQLLETYVAYLTAAGRIQDAIGFLTQIKGADPLAVCLMLAKAAAQNHDENLAVSSLREASGFLTPRQTIAEMHNPVFDSIARTGSFEELLHQQELAAVSHSTSLSTNRIGD
ncbi:MAG: tetratricopeptide repeat protein [Verrucomicrobia bacterium]|nr:tetratricopeptide repeat protein [Verrucomicrobiota bacterium]